MKYITKQSKSALINEVRRLKEKLKVMDRFWMFKNSLSHRILTEKSPDNILRMQGAVAAYYIFNEYLQNGKEAYINHKEISKIFIDTFTQ